MQIRFSVWNNLSQFIIRCFGANDYLLCAQSCPTLCHPWTIVHQASLSMKFPRQEYWVGAISFSKDKWLLCWKYSALYSLYPYGYNSHWEFELLKKYTFWKYLKILSEIINLCFCNSLGEVQMEVNGLAYPQVTIQLYGWIEKPIWKCIHF